MSRHTELDPQLVPPSTAAVAVAVMEPLSVKRSLALHAWHSVWLYLCRLAWSNLRQGLILSLKSTFL
jgi:hypothetical protein